MFWRRTVGFEGSTFYLYRNEDEDPVCQFFLTIEMLQDVQDLSDRGIGDHSLIGAIEAAISSRTNLTEEELKGAIDALIPEVAY